ncbi:CAZyme family AA1 [Penicillium macrosclerotiorum]|uniref:CAZyme family AA1 n=1 Tax=Penicillium macrosclerotiorum TaxID=303699 RepID=UPI002549A12D|nr:CAZyme family AA1 [Penicillium macrosclerotiorum]KAJ5683455.1 CAZyme family AA1 [Penicillium macrosclerotiorum]
MFVSFFIIFTYTLATAAFSIPGLEARKSSKACKGNSAHKRTKWCDYTINTDYTEIVPNTGVTREYWFSIDEVTVAPDGVFRSAMAVNGTIPGPTIYADWGDNVVIHVTNHLDAVKNGTSIHWHGIRQNYTNQNDGVVSITQCPTAPGSSITYKWRAVQYGTSWWHSHIGLQAWEGVFGGIIINGPASSNYDVDQGVMFLNDWSHATADQLFIQAQTRGPPTLDNGLINGTNVFNDTSGSRFTMRANKGAKYRIRLINAAIDTHWKFMIDNHTLTVIAMDLVPIKPYTTQWINIGMGQRYDIIVEMNQADVARNFWIRAIPQTECSENESVDNIKGILHYHTKVGTPTTSPYDYGVDACIDEDLSNLVPVVSKSVSNPDWDSMEDVTVARNSNNLFRWYLNSTTMQVDWQDPTLLQIYNDVTEFSDSSGVIELPNANEWVYLLINTSLPISHPIHLHGHDFFILAQGTNPWDGTTISHTNPPRRDTAMLESTGYLLIAFETDNPGAWLMHCHIGWHTSEGFALQFVERYDEIKKLIDHKSLEKNCKSWISYDTSYNIEQDDSGV